MSDLTRDTAYLVKNGVPYDRVITMSKEEAAEAAGHFRQLELEAGVKYVMWRLAILVTLIVGAVALIIVTNLRLKGS